MTDQPSQGEDAVFLPQVGLSGPLASAIADLASLNRDIGFARDCANTYASNAAPATPDDAAFLMQSVWSAGAISYRRAFTSGRAHLVKQGKRLKLNDAWRDIVDPELLEAHDKVLEMASQHIAHRVGNHEGVVVVAVLSPPPAPREVLGVGEMLVHMIGPKPDVAEKLVTVCGILLELIGQEKERLQGILLEKLREEDIDALYEDAETPGP